MIRFIPVAGLFGMTGMVFAHGGTPSLHPEFTSSPVPVRAAHVRWKASPPLARGLEAWASGRHDLARRWFESAVRRIPGDPIAWHNLGAAYYTASRFEEALTAFAWERLLSPVPAAPAAWYGIGMCYEALGHLAAAEHAFIVAVQAAPREWEYWHRLAEVLGAQGKVHPATYAAGRAAGLRPRPGRLSSSWTRRHASIMGVRIPHIPSMGRDVRIPIIPYPAGR